MKMRGIVIIFVTFLGFYTYDELTKPEVTILPTELVNTTSFINSPNQDSLRIYIYELINEYRRVNGLYELIENKDVHHYTQDWSDKMSSSLVMSHGTGDDTPLNRWYVFKDSPNGKSCGLRYCENVVATYIVNRFHNQRQLAEQIIKQWKNSPSHNKALLRNDEGYIYHSFSCSMGEDGRVYGTWLNVTEQNDIY